MLYITKVTELISHVHIVQDNKKKKKKRKLKNKQKIHHMLTY